MLLASQLSNWFKLQKLRKNWPPLPFSCVPQTQGRGGLLLGACMRNITDTDVAKKFLSLKESAERRGKHFNLSLTSVRNLLQADKCKLTGIPLNSTNFSVDRIDNTKGYIKGNVCACDKAINTLKGNIEDHLLREGADLKKFLKDWRKLL